MKIEAAEYMIPVIKRDEIVTTVNNGRKLSPLDKLRNETVKLKQESAAQKQVLAEKFLLKYFGNCDDLGIAEIEADSLYKSLKAYRDYKEWMSNSDEIDPAVKINIRELDTIDLYDSCIENKRRWKTINHNQSWNEPVQKQSDAQFALWAQITRIVLEAVVIESREGEVKQMFDDINKHLKRNRSESR